MIDDDPKKSDLEIYVLEKKKTENRKRGSRQTDRVRDRESEKPFVIKKKKTCCTLNSF